MLTRQTQRPGSESNSRFIVGRLALGLALWGGLLLASAARAAEAPPQMIVPGQFGVSATGAATYTIPIVVPPGTAGMVPNLSLRYSSQAGDGIVGLGWSLAGLPSITRCPRTLAQDSVHGGVNYNSDDRFCLDGQRLIVISGTYGADLSEYRTEIDNFTKIIAHTASGVTGPAWFEVHLRSGQVLEFGNLLTGASAADSRVFAVGTTTVRAWAVDKITDTTGNYLTVTYNCAPVVSSACSDSDRVSNGEVYPLHVDYTGNAAASVSPFNSVQFSYATRADITPRYQAGSLLQPTMILTHITTMQGANTVYDYAIAYNTGTSTTHSQVKSVTQCDASSNCFAPTTFDWQGVAGLPTMTGTPLGLAQGTTLVPGDFNGDGLTDVLVHGGSNCGISLGTNTGMFPASSILANYTEWTVESGHYSGTYVEDQQPCFLASYTRGRNTPSDFNGDGYTDLVISQNHAANTPYLHPLLNDTAGNLTEAGSGVFPSELPLAITDFNGDGRADLLARLSPTGTPTYQVDFGAGDGTFPTVGATYTGTLSFLTGDFDGDGCADVLRSSAPWTIDYSCHPATSSSTVTTSSGAQLTIGDFNGDGLSDILVTYASSAGTLYLSTGTGTVATAFSVPSGWGSYTIVVGDWNGDGKDDIALIAPGASAHQIWLSTGTGFASATTISNSDTGSTAVVADWNNDGAEDIWLQRASGDALYTFAYVPELMTAVHNGIGATTTITYDRLNQNGTFYGKGAGASYPVQDVDGPIYTVKEVDASNGIGSFYATTYAYAGLRKDLAGRGFLGFSSVTVSDSQTNLVQETDYSTTFPYAGLVTGQTVTHSGSTVLKSVANTYHDDATNCGVTEASGVYFVCLTQSATTASHDLSGAALPTTTTAYSSFDAYGNPQTIVATTSLGGSTTQTVTTSNTYNNDPTNWFIGQLLTTATESHIIGASDVTRSLSFAYDTTTGILKQTIVEPSHCENLLQTDYTLDAFGNRTAAAVSGAGCSGGDTRAIATRTSHAGYDADGTFATSTTNALSQADSWAFSAAFGGPTGHTDIDSRVFAWSYDTLGRASLATNPDGTKVSVTYAFCSGVNGGSASCPTYGAYLKSVEALSSASAQIGPIVTTYYDALNRVIATDLQGFDASTIRSAVQYDAKGRVQQTSRPYFTASPPCASSLPCWTSFTYDDLGRVTETDFPNGGSETASYNGLVVTTANDHSQSNVTTRNAQGLTASVEDAASHTTSYTYDAFGNVLTVSDPAGNTVTNVYDRRGNRTDSTDPDMGHWTYVSDVLGELKTQNDARSQATTLTYDLIGRATGRSEADMTTTWTWDTATHGIGELTSVSAIGTAAGSTTQPFIRTMAYDSIGRPAQTMLAQGATTGTYTTAYNATNGQIDTLTYPSGFVAKYVYTALGYLSQVEDNATSSVLFTVNSRDAELHATQQTAGNGVVTDLSYAATTGQTTAISAGSGAVAALGFSYDTLGNLTGRTDTNQGVYEKFCYDNLNRLTNSATASSSPSLCSSTGGGITAKTVAYDQLGNITSKSDVGSYTYSGSGAGPHAVTSITGTVNGVVNPTYTYDNNGNMTAGAGRSVGYTSFNMANSIAQGTLTATIVYDGDHMRFKMSHLTSGTTTDKTLYRNDPISGGAEELFINSSAISWSDYIRVDGQIVAQRSCQTIPGASSCSATPTWLYFVTDNLSSTTVLTNASAAVSERDSYDAWGRRRNTDGTDNSGCSITSATTRGFTGHEMLDNLCQINANARIYDPTIGKFMSADPVVQDALDGQTYNSYAYVENNPLSLTDPSGYDSEGCGTKQNPCLNTSGGTTIETVVVTANKIQDGHSAALLGVISGGGGGGRPGNIGSGLGRLNTTAPNSQMIELVTVVGELPAAATLHANVPGSVIFTPSSFGGLQTGGALGTGAALQIPYTPCSALTRIMKGSFGAWSTLDGTAAFGMGFGLDVIGGGAIAAGCGQPAAPATCGLSVVAGVSIIAASGGAYWTSYEVYKNEAIPELGEAFGTCHA